MLRFTVKKGLKKGLKKFAGLEKRATFAPAFKAQYIDIPGPVFKGEGFKGFSLLKMVKKDLEDKG